MNQPVPAARYAYLLVAVAVGCSLTSMLVAQERPFDTTACALTQHPDRYNEGLVSVEGLITVGPDEFLLHDADCDDEHGKIWLEFGGGVESPATASAHLPSHRPHTFESLDLPLNRDRDFDAMQKLLQEAQKSGKTRMLRATLIGKYFPGKPAITASGAAMRSGYGHMGCCSLLVIEEVAAVGSELEEPVDFSPASKTNPRTLTKGCTVEELQVPPREDEDQLERKSLEDEYQYLHNAKKVAARAIAVQEQTSAKNSADDVEKRLQAESVTQSLASYTWAAPDATTSYHVIVNKPYWLLQTAVSGDAVIWVPKSISKTECAGKPK